MFFLKLFILLQLAATFFAIHSNAFNLSRVLKLKHTPRTARQLRDYHVKNSDVEDHHWLGMGKYYMSDYPNDILRDDWSFGTAPNNVYWTNIESGHNQLWLIDSSYPNVTARVNRYNSSASSTSKKIGTATGGYTGITQLNGLTYRDNVSFFETSFEKTFDTITKSVDLKTGKELVFTIDGVVGFAWNLTEDIVNMTPESSLVLHCLNYFGGKRVFSFWLERDIVGDSSEGFTTFSDYDDARCKTDRTFVPLSYYDDFSPLAFQVDAFTFGQYSTRRGGLGKVDTGLPVIFLPASPYRAVYNKLKPEYDDKLKLYKTDCSNRGVFPPFIFTIGGRDFQLRSNYYVMHIDLGDGKCALTIEQSLETDIPWAFGNPFLREFCQHFDVDNKQIGFSTALFEPE